MKRTWTSAVTFLLIVGAALTALIAQDSRQRSSSNQRQSSSSSSSQRNAQSTPQTGNQSTGQSQYPDAEVRLRYDDERDRLSIDVDEDIQFRRGNQQQAWTDDGRLDVRYDRDRNRFSGTAEGALRMNQVSRDMAQWWQSWWQDERQARRNRDEGAEGGAREFIRRHDSNGDGYLTRSELPQGMRTDFVSVDRDNDDYLTQRELRYWGHLMADIRGQSTAGRQDADYSRTRSQDDQTWSEWWASWWSDDASGQSRDESSSAAARQFVRQHDDNGDGYISRSEMPRRMAGDFARVDSNQDGYLSRSEIRQNSTPYYGLSGRIRTSSGTAYDRDDDNEQSWSEWWSSWWDDGSRSGTAEQIAEQGAREFIRRHDQNSDGYLVRSEMPQRMYDEFSEIDSDGSRSLSRTEIRSYASRTRDRSLSSSQSTSRQGPSSRLSSGQSPLDAAYEWIIDAYQGRVSSSELQDAYRLLSRIDANADGQLSQSELRQRREQIVREWSENIFRKLDSNGDGYLSRSEAGNSLFARQFQQFDRDDDDSLTRSEVRRTLEQRFDTASSAGSDDDSQSRR